MTSWLLHRLRLAVLAAGVLAALAMARPSVAPDVEVTIVQEEDLQFLVTYELRRPLRSLSFMALGDDYQATNWRIQTPDFVFEEAPGKVFLKRSDLRKFKRVVVRVTPVNARLQKAYQP
ncbi:MAG: hypothetical protein ACX939_14380, partial [Hyphococcus sp.]